MAVNYTDLKVAVEDTVENTFSATDFATLTRLAEQKIYQSIQLPILRKDATLALTGGVQTVNLPADFLAAYSVAVFSTLLGSSGAREFLLNKDVNFMRESYPVPATTGTPRYYALDGTDTGNDLIQKIILGPTPITGSVGVELLLPPAKHRHRRHYVARRQLRVGADQRDCSSKSHALCSKSRHDVDVPDAVQRVVPAVEEPWVTERTVCDAYRNGQVRNPVK
jgi:hypothetical protein